MTYVFIKLFWWLLVAFVIGLATGWLTFNRNAKSSRMGWLSLWLGLFVLGCVLAFLKVLPDAAGFWLETALFTFGAFIIGCLLGSWLCSFTRPSIYVGDRGYQRDANIAIPAVPASRADAYPGSKPLAVAAPANGGDDLKLIRGIGPKNEKILNELGIYRFCQIGDWTAANADWVNHHIAFPGRIEREQWIEQGKLLCAGYETEYSRAVRAGSIRIDENADKALTDAELAALRSSLPEFVGAVEGEDRHEGRRPLGFASARGGLPDDLKLIRGIGPQNEGLLHGLGVWHFDQIAAWTQEHALWVGSYLAFPGRIEREEWVAQAKVLAKGGSTEFAERVKKGEVPSSMDDGTQGQDNILPVEEKSH